MKKQLFLIRFLLLSGIFLCCIACDIQEHKSYDVVVYGGTPGGIMASIAAAREGASVVLLEQTKHIGGLSTSGLNRDEGEHMDRSTLGGLCDLFTSEAARRSGTKVHLGNSARIWQSHIAEQVFLDMLKEHKVPVCYEQSIENVSMKGAKIKQLAVQDGQVYKAKVFIDASYEGDLFARAGVTYTLGRESKEAYGESKAGVRYMDEKIDVSPYDDDGSLLPGVMPGPLPEEYAASDHPICYNIRLNLTSEKENMHPIEKPSGYDPKQHELMARCIQAGYIKNLGRYRTI